jgi:hypothetical protein
MVLRQSLLVLSTVVVLGLGACSNNSTTSSPAAPTGNTGSPGNKQGGQVVKAGDYHMEFIPSKEGDGTHLDFFLYKGNSAEVLPNAKITARVKFPDGTQKEIPLKYEPENKHYGEKLPDASQAGDYQVAILTDINGEKINGRFSFKQ